MNILSKLIPIGNCPSFGDGLIDTVNARDLHSALKVVNPFRNWIKDRLENCKFMEGQDYVSFAEKTANPLGGRPSKLYFLTLDAAKHFAMLERNDQGFKVRQYFVEFEKQAKKTLPAQTYQELVADTLKANSELIARLGQEIEVRDAKIAVIAPKAEVFDAHCGRGMTLGKFAKTLRGVNQNAVKNSLYRAGVLYHANGGYRVYAKYRDTHFEEKASNYNDGEYDIFILPEGKKLVTELYREGALTLKVGYAA